jgi:hypothetical protein
MNQVTILVQAKGDPKNLLDTKEKAANFQDGLTVIFMEGATQGGQIGIEFIFKGKDIYGKETIVGAAVTENNFEALAGAFIGVRMRFARMPPDQWALVRHYVKEKAKNFLAFLSPHQRNVVENDVKKFFGL